MATVTAAKNTRVQATGPVIGNRLGWRAFRLIAVFLGTIFALYPVLIVIGASLDPTNSLSGQTLIPRNITFDNYAKLFDSTQISIFTWLWNSIKVSTITTFITLTLTTFAAFAFSRFRYKYRRATLLATLVIQVFPSILSLVAFYLLLQQLGNIVPWLGLNTHGGLILIYCGGALGANAWLMKGYFDTIPRELDESAQVDGASHLTVFFRIVLPLIRPILAVIGLLAFVGTFNDFLLPRILLKSVDQYTLAVGLTTFLDKNYTKEWGIFAAGALIGAGPIIALFLVLQTQFIAGLSAGAVKG